jgi:hypothetical protein
VGGQPGERLIHRGADTGQTAVTLAVVATHSAAHAYAQAPTCDLAATQPCKMRVEIC